MELHLSIFLRDLLIARGYFCLFHFLMVLKAGRPSNPNGKLRFSIAPRDSSSAIV